MPTRARRAWFLALAAIAVVACSRTDIQDVGGRGGTGWGGSSSGSSSGNGGSGVGVGGGCQEDASITCGGGGQGISCSAGTNPESEDASLTCSDPVPTSDGEESYCCYSTGCGGCPSTCAPDDAMTATCPSGTYGFVCAAGDDPTTYDSSLTCGAPTPDGANDDYCCAYSGGSSSSGGGAIPPGCALDSTVDCTGSGANGYACAAGDNPENYDGLVCSDPTPNGSEDDFCCFTGGTWSTTTCNPDDAMSGFCAPGAYGFLCASGDDPTTYDASLTCSTNRPDPDGVHDDYCCTY